ncbi:hypothetical protein ACKVEX_15275 [Rhodocyclaceae bacterium SMB388]
MPSRRHWQADASWCRIPYPPGFPILVPGQVISQEIVTFMRALDVKEIHGYRTELGLRIFTEEALARLQPTEVKALAVADGAEQ